MEDNNTELKGNTGEEFDDPAGEIYFVRLNYSERVQHLILVVCFVVLVITGFMLKVPEDMVRILGKAGQTVFFWRSILHRQAGTIMILVSLYHLYYIIFKPSGRRWIKDMMMGPKDLKEMAATLLYYMGLKNSPPEYDRFCYKHKFEYGALFLGNTLIAVSGLLLWTDYKWSKFALDISTLIHGMEAILATLAIMIWHLYEVHLKPRKFPIDNMWLTGVIDEEEIKEEHPLHYKKIMASPDLHDIYIKRERPATINNIRLTGVIDEEEIKEEHPSHYKELMAAPESQEAGINSD
jgi:formate dehydrogenase gamma subunit